MARDLHDVIGHNISLINVQAGVGLDLMDSRPEQARAALTAIKPVSGRPSTSCEPCWPRCARRARTSRWPPVPGWTGFRSWSG